MLFAIVITSAASLYVFLMFLMTLVRLIFVVVDFTVCAIFLVISGISWMYD